MPYVSIRGRAPNQMQLSRYVKVVRGMAGMGMGQDDSDFGDGGDVPIVTPYTPPPFSSSDISNLQSEAATASANIGASGQQLLSDLGIDISGVDPTVVPGAIAAASSPSSGGGFNLSSFLNSLTGAAASSAKLYQSLQTPALIAGTNAIYNPATGQYYNPTTGQVVNPGGTSTLGLPNIDPTTLLLYGGLAVGAVFLLSMLGKH